MITYLTPSEALLRAVTAATSKEAGEAKTMKAVSKDLLAVARGNGFAKSEELRGATYRVRQLCNEAMQCIPTDAFFRVMQAHCGHEATLDELVEHCISRMRETGEIFSDAEIAQELRNMDLQRAFSAAERLVLAILIAELVRRTMDVDRAAETLERLHTNR